MTVIARKLIENPRTTRLCERCRSPIVGPQMRYFGGAEGQKPYAIYQHPDAATCVEVESAHWGMWPSASSTVEPTGVEGETVANQDEGKP